MSGLYRVSRAFVCAVVVAFLAGCSTLSWLGDPHSSVDGQRRHALSQARELVEVAGLKLDSVYLRLNFAGIGDQQPYSPTVDINGTLDHAPSQSETDALLKDWSAKLAKRGWKANTNSYTHAETIAFTKKGDSLIIYSPTSGEHPDAVEAYYTNRDVYITDTKDIEPYDSGADMDLLAKAANSGDSLPKRPIKDPLKIDFDPYNH